VSDARCCWPTARAAINFNDGFGGGNIVKGNLIFNTCRESGDQQAETQQAFTAPNAS